MLALPVSNAPYECLYQERHEEMTHVHPDWNENVNEDCDVALMRMPHPFDIPFLALAASIYSIYAINTVYTFNLCS